MWVACAPLAARGDGTIEGTVALPAARPAVTPKPRYAEATSYTVGEPDLPAAVVYLEGDGGEAPPSAAAPVLMTQRQYQFAPGLLAVRTGTAVAFPNLDDEYHNVFSYSKPKRFDLGRYQKAERPPVLTFDQPGVVRLYCEIHEHMRGTILVLDTPWFAKTDAAGRYRLPGVPAGRWVVKAWREDESVLARAVELRDGETLRVDLGAP